MARRLAEQREPDAHGTVIGVDRDDGRLRDRLASRRYARRREATMIAEEHVEGAGWVPGAGEWQRSWRSPPPATLLGRLRCADTIRLSPSPSERSRRARRLCVEPSPTSCRRAPSGVQSPTGSADLALCGNVAPYRGLRQRANRPCVRLTTRGVADPRRHRTRAANGLIGGFLDRRPFRRPDHRAASIATCYSRERRGRRLTRRCAGVERRCGAGYLCGISGAYGRPGNAARRALPAHRVPWRGVAVAPLLRHERSALAAWHRPPQRTLCASSSSAFRITQSAYDEIRASVGRLLAEHGWPLGCSGTDGVVRHFHFDSGAASPGSTCSPDHGALSRLFAETWNPAGTGLLGFEHSHLPGCRAARTTTSLTRREFSPRSRRLTACCCRS
jgi:hypothetical protein